MGWGSLSLSYLSLAHPLFANNAFFLSFFFCGQTPKRFGKICQVKA
jgi:hypothetical protein